MTVSDTTELLTISEAADQLGVAPSTVRVLIHQGRLPVAVKGRLRNLLDPRAVDAYARSRRNQRALAKEPARRLVETYGLLRPGHIPLAYWEIIVRYAQTDATLEEIAADAGISRERVRRIIQTTTAEVYPLPIS